MQTRGASSPGRAPVATGGKVIFGATVLSIAVCGFLSLTVLAAIFGKPSFGKRDVSAADSKTGKRFKNTASGLSSGKVVEEKLSDPDVALRRLVSRLKQNLEIETVFFCPDPGWHSGKTCAIVDFVGFREAEQEANNKDLLELIQVQSQFKRVFIIHYDSQERARMQGDNLRQEGMSSSWGHFYFQGDPEKIAAIRRCLRGG